jgi:hypothetical protein
LGLGAVHTNSLSGNRRKISKALSRACTTGSAKRNALARCPLTSVGWFSCRKTRFPMAQSWLIRWTSRRRRLEGLPHPLDRDAAPQHLAGDFRQGIELGEGQWRLAQLPLGIIRMVTQDEQLRSGLEVELIGLLHELLVREPATSDGKWRLPLARLLV